MNRFAALLDQLAFEPSRNGKLRLMSAYFRSTPDPDRGWALAAMTDSLKFSHARPALIRALISDRTDPELFALSYDYVGDLSETVALMWPAPRNAQALHLSLSGVIDVLQSTGKAQLPSALADMLDRLDETGRWALLKLITGGLRTGASARLARIALAQLMASPDAGEIENIWPSLKPPYQDLFAWLEGRAEKPAASDPAPFRPPMLAHPLDEKDTASLDPLQFAAEWKWDGARVQACAGALPDGARVARLYSRSGEDISAAFPELIAMLVDQRFGEAAIDGELLVRHEGRTGSFADLQQRLNRKSPGRKMLVEYPAFIRAYDLLAWNGVDLRSQSFSNRREQLEIFVAGLGEAPVEISPLLQFESWDGLRQAREGAHDSATGGEPVEGLMLKRLESPYLAGRAKGHWYKWKRQPFNIDAVMMYAQRGHGKRSSLYSDYTFGVWRMRDNALELTPVGKAYSGFSDAELKRLDRFVRDHTINRYGPVREVAHEPDNGLVLEVEFEGIQRSARHKSGIALRFPRIARIRWDKPPREAAMIEELENLLPVKTGA